MNQEENNEQSSQFTEERPNCQGPGDYGHIQRHFLCVYPGRWTSIRSEPGFDLLYAHGGGPAVRPHLSADGGQGAKAVERHDPRHHYGDHLVCHGDALGVLSGLHRYGDHRGPCGWHRPLPQQGHQPAVLHADLPGRHLHLCGVLHRPGGVGQHHAGERHGAVLH